jgi:hypothetical protein
MSSLLRALLLLSLLSSCSKDPAAPPADLGIGEGTVVDLGTLDKPTRRDGGQTCEEIKTELAIQVELAKVCQPQSATKQCTRQIKRDKLPCGCPIFVNPANVAATARIDLLRGAWRRKGCGATIDCKNCEVPSSGTCEATPPNSKAPGLCKTVL